MAKGDMLLEQCQCGHVLDEHEHSKSSTPPCAIEGCYCIAFESIDGAEDDEESGE